MLKIVAQTEDNSVLVEVEITAICLGGEIAISHVEHRFLCQCHPKVQIEGMLIKVTVECLRICSTKVIPSPHRDSGCDLMVIVCVEAILSKACLRLRKSGVETRRFGTLVITGDRQPPTFGGNNRYSIIYVICSDEVR